MDHLPVRVDLLLLPVQGQARPEWRQPLPLCDLAAARDPEKAAAYVAAVGRIALRTDGSPEERLEVVCDAIRAAACEFLPPGARSQRKH